MENKNLFSIISLVCGLLGIILTFTPAAIAGLIIAIMGLAFVSFARKKEGRNGMNKAGFVLSLIAVILWIIVIIVLGVVAGVMIGAAGALAG